MAVQKRGENGRRGDGKEKEKEEGKGMRMGTTEAGLVMGVKALHAQR